MVCDICANKKATVHLTEIVDDQVSEMHLCEECARAKSVQMEQQFGLADLLAGLSDFGKQMQESEVQKMVCPRCGTNYDDFKKFGRLGCSECYGAFKAQLATLLKRIHGSNRHLGKSPAGLPHEQKRKVEDLRDLKEQLQQAIEGENFEKAAELRDRIRKMEQREKG